MKKVIILTSVALLIMSILSGCGNSAKKNEKNNLTTLEAVKEAGVITMGLNDTYPPMEFRDEKHNIVGFDVDLGKEIGKKLGVKTEIITNDWKGIILSLKSKKYDMILSGMSITPDREKEINFSKPYINGGQRLVIKKKNDNIKNIEDVKGKILGCQIGTTGQTAGEKIEGIKELKKYDGVTEAFGDLSLGRIDAVIADAQVGKYYLSKRGHDLVMLDINLTQEPIGIGFRKEDKDLKNAVQNAIDDMHEDGTMSKLSIKWFGEDIYKK